MTTPTEPRPRPIYAAAVDVSRVTGLLGSILTALTGWGILSAEQGDALVGLLGAIPGAVSLVFAVLVAFHVVRRAEPLVTPLSDPRDDAGRPLVVEGSIAP